MSRKRAHPYHPLYGCVLKMRRGDEHFDALQSSMRDLMERDPYEIVRDSDPEADRHVVRVKVRERPPPESRPARTLRGFVDEILAV